MLQNQSFEMSFLQEELSASQTELFVLESVNALNEASEEEEKKPSKAGELAKKAKDFFIKIAKAISEAFKKFTTFFVEVYKKLEYRLTDVKKYVEGVKSKAELEEARSYTLLSSSALKNLQELAKADSPHFDRGFENAKSGLNDEKHIVKGSIKKISDARDAVKAASYSVSKVKAAASVVSQSNKKAQEAAKNGVSAAAKEDKEAINENKRVATNASKAHSLSSSAISKTIKLSNQTLATAFSAAKAINAAGKKSDKKETKPATA